MNQRVRKPGGFTEKKMEIQKPSGNDKWSGLSKILVLAGTAAGVVLPILWDHYKTTSAIAVHQLSSTTLVESPKEISGLQITYASKKIERISKTIFEVSNSGRTSILAKDIITPFRVQFSSTTKILDVEIEEMTPKNIAATVNQNGQSAIDINFPLLNPGDAFRFGVLLTGADPETFEATARIVGIQQVETRKAPGKTASESHHPLVGVFSVLSLMISLFAFFNRGEESMAIAISKNGIFVPVPVRSKAEALQRTAAISNALPPKDLQAMRLAIRSSTDADLASGKLQKALEDAVSLALPKRTGALEAGIVFLFIGLLGLWYAV